MESLLIITPLNLTNRLKHAIITRSVIKTFRRMKIAMVGQKGIPAIYGGVERHVEELAQELAKQGHEVLVYARKWYSRSVASHPGIKVIFTPSFHTKHLDTITHTFISTFHAMFHKADVIHFHGVGPSLLSWLPRIFSPRTKVIATFHSIDRYHQKWGAFAKFVLRCGEKAACLFPHQTISVSKTTQKYCLNEYEKITNYVPNGVRFMEAGKAADLFRFGLEPKKYLLMVSRLVPHKGAHYLINAWKLAQKQFPNSLAGYKLVIVGGSVFTDKYTESLFKLRESNPSIVFPGWQSGLALASLYANAKLFIHPSENEGLPITVLQAMSFGRSVLVSDIPEHQEFVTDSRFWFVNASANSLANKIISLISQPELLEAAGAENAKIVSKNFNWPDIAKTTSELYKKQPQVESAAELKIA